MKTTIRSVLFILAFLCLAAVGPNIQAVSPPPDGGYANFTTAEGQNALLSLTSGAGNTAVGWYSLSSDTTTGFNTAVGAGALALNTQENNTAVGAAALLLNVSGDDNTAVGVAALLYNDTAFDNTAIGAEALRSNESGSYNNAVGHAALFSNVSGTNNTAVGDLALANCNGNFNTALGSGAGYKQESGSDNIYIGAAVSGVTGENNTIRIGDNLSDTGGESACYIGGIFNQIAPGGVAVYVSSDGKLGTGPSSKRFKQDIKPIDNASAAILALKPVTFRYKKELDPTGTAQFGLVAEDVEKVEPALVARDKEGKPYSVRYDQVNAMLLNEFLKEHQRVEEQNCKLQDQAHKIQEQEATIAELKNEMEVVVAHQRAQDSTIQKVSAQIQVSRAPQQIATRD